MEKVHFNKNIYSQQAIKQAIKDFSQYADFKSKLNGDYLEVTIDNIKSEDKDDIKDEFANYVLGLMS